MEDEERARVAEIRPERAGDIVAIRNVNDRAFGRPNEGGVIEQLRRDSVGLVSLVAQLDGEVVGHILFSPVRLEAEDGRSWSGMGLAPLAVSPERQRRGIGSDLVRTGLISLRGTPCPFVVVLGNPDYYSWFGFEPAARHGIRCKWDVPEAAFMILMLDEAGMRGASGLARYRGEWDAATWPPPASIGREPYVHLSFGRRA
jgi:putative acetyltransferase